MSSLQQKLYAIIPSGKYTYIDQIRGWRRRYFQSEEIRFIHAECGKKSIRIRVRMAPFGRGYRIWFQITRPTDAVLRFLATLDDVLPNYIEAAYDLTFPDEFELRKASDLFDRHMVKKWPSKSGSTVFGEGETRTFYSGPRGSRNLLTRYSDHPSRITGEVDCLHFEWRVCGREALGSLGITTPADLIGFDFYSFWKKRLLVYEYDAERFGRHHSNWYFKSNRKPRRRAIITNKLAYSADRSVGNLLFRRAQSVQVLVETWNGKFNVWASLKPICIEHLLPEKTEKQDAMK